MRVHLQAERVSAGALATSRHAQLVLQRCGDHRWGFSGFEVGEGSHQADPGILLPPSNHVGIGFHSRQRFDQLFPRRLANTVSGRDKK